MKKVVLFVLIFLFQLSAIGQTMIAEDYYVKAFNEMSNMLSGKESLSIKRAVYLAEWAYYEGKLDYQNDFCNEIERIIQFINRFYTINKLNSFKTGKQMALNEYLFNPYSGNGYKPYTYDFDNFTLDNDKWETQFVSTVLKTHKGQCRSLPWMYKILANEINAAVSIAHAPRHCYIMYKDEDHLTPEEWINLELTSHQMQPSFWIKEDYEICDSAIYAGTYMTPLTDIETVACQIAELALGYKEKFKRYDEFTFYSSSRSLEFYPMNPNALIIRGKSLEKMIQVHMEQNGHIVDDYVLYLIQLMNETKSQFHKTYMTLETEEIRERRLHQTMKAKKITHNIELSK